MILAYFEIYIDLMSDIKLTNKAKYWWKICEQARKLGVNKFGPRAQKYDIEAKFPTENYKELRKEGFLGICIPKENGGLGASFRAYCLAAAEIGRYCGSTALTWNMHVCSTLWTGSLADSLKMPKKIKRRRAPRRKRRVKIVRKKQKKNLAVKRRYTNKLKHSLPFLLRGT